MPTQQEIDAAQAKLTLLAKERAQFIAGGSNNFMESHQAQLKDAFEKTGVTEAQWLTTSDNELATLRATRAAIRRDIDFPLPPR